MRTNDAATTRQFSASYRYLRATVNGAQTFLVFGGMEQDKQTELWFSADGEVIRLRNGHIVGTAGIVPDWRNVKEASFPSWRSIQQHKERANTAFSYERTRDVMPGYAFGLRETVSVVPIDAPKRTALQEINPNALQWFQETSVSAREKVATLPPAFFAVDFAGDQEKVVYSEQCLSAELCLTLQMWPAFEKTSTDTSTRKAG